MNSFGLSIEDFFNGNYVNDFHQKSSPFFENAREAKMNSIKYAPCKFCVLHKIQDGVRVENEEVDFNDIRSDTTVIQSLGNVFDYTFS